MVPDRAAGVTILLDHLEQQMYADRDAWCQARVGRHWSLEQLEETAWDVHAALVGRTSDHRRLSRLRSDFDAVSEAVARAERAGHARDVRRERHAAEQALLSMLGRAYDWGYVDVCPASRETPDGARTRSLSAPRPR